MAAFKTKEKRNGVQRSSYLSIKPDFRSVDFLLESKGTLENQIKEATAVAEIARLNTEIREGLSSTESVKLTSEIRKAVSAGEKAEIRKGVVHAVREKLSRILEAIIAFFSGKRKARLTKRGREALLQLKELANVLSISSAGSEFLEFEVAFGKAYYDIMSASHMADRYKLKEDKAYVDGYRRAIEGFVEAVT